MKEKERGCTKENIKKTNAQKPKERKRAQNDLNWERYYKNFIKTAVDKYIADKARMNVLSYKMKNISKIAEMAVAFSIALEHSKKNSFSMSYNEAADLAFEAIASKNYKKRNYQYELNLIDIIKNAFSANNCVNFPIEYKDLLSIFFGGQRCTKVIQGNVIRCKNEIMYIFTGLSVIMKDMKISNNLNFDFLQREIENFAGINITNLDYFKELGASFINDVKNNPINIKKYKNHSLYNIEYVEILPYMAINRLYYWNSFCKIKK